jgi:hypothetical protein
LGKILQEDETLSGIAELIESIDQEQGLGISYVEIPKEEGEEQEEDGGGSEK